MINGNLETSESNNDVKLDKNENSESKMNNVLKLINDNMTNVSNIIVINEHECLCLTCQVCHVKTSLYFHLLNSTFTDTFLLLLFMT